MSNGSVAAGISARCCCGGVWAVVFERRTAIGAPSVVSSLEQALNLTHTVDFIALCAGDIRKNSPAGRRCRHRRPWIRRHQSPCAAEGRLCRTAGWGAAMQPRSRTIYAGSPMLSTRMAWQRLRRHCRHSATRTHEPPLSSGPRYVGAQNAITAGSRRFSRPSAEDAFGRFWLHGGRATSHRSMPLRRRLPR